MSFVNIEQLAYNLNRYKTTSKRGAIVFLGAGASQSGNIPLAGKIIEDVLSTYCNSPKLSKLSPEEKSDYYKVMDCLTPHDRKELFLGYIKNAKTNITHIYLAQLMEAGYVDYILTVNFDNLTQRALSLLNVFPATYDIAMSKGLTTSTFNNPGIVFLHGQHHGFNLLNTEDEFQPVEELIVSSFQRICERPWVVVGYGATDPVFNYINRLGRFDNCLYWVCHKEEMPKENVMNLINDTNKNASLIRGYNSDSFFQKLHLEIQSIDKDVPDPQILTTPFSHLQTLHDSIVEINDDMPIVKERMEATKRLVNDAINRYENQNIPTPAKLDDVQVDILLLALVNIIAKGDYNQIPQFEELLKGSLNHLEVKKVLSGGYINWGVSLITQLGNNSLDNKIYETVVAKYKRAIELNPQSALAYANLGGTLTRYSRNLPKNESEKMFMEAISKYKTALEIDPNNDFAYTNWGITLSNMADIYNWERAEGMYKEAIQKFEFVANNLNVETQENYSNWGLSLSRLAKNSSVLDIAENLYNESNEKYEKATILKPDGDTINNWASNYISLSHFKEGNDRVQLLNKALEKSRRAIELGGSNYNYACTNALLGINDEAFKYLEETLLKAQISFEHVENDKDWESLREDPRYKKMQEQYGKIHLPHSA